MYWLLFFSFLLLYFTLLFVTFKSEFFWSCSEVICKRYTKYTCIWLRLMCDTLNVRASTHSAIKLICCALQSGWLKSSSKCGGVFYLIGPKSPKKGPHCLWMAPSKKTECHKSCWCRIFELIWRSVHINKA